MSAASNALAGQLSAIDRRGADRENLALWSRIRMPSQPDYALRICNVTPLGVMAMTPCPAHDGDTVQIELPAIGWHEARIIWVLGDRIGAEFVRPVDRDQFQRFIAFQR
jgi:hypothetical protein